MSTLALIRYLYEDLRRRNYQQIKQKSIAYGYAGLGADGKVPIAQLPPFGGGGTGNLSVVYYWGGPLSIIMAPVGPIQIWS